jgi:hypothetical protein
MPAIGTCMRKQLDCRSIAWPVPQSSFRFPGTAGVGERLSMALPDVGELGLQLGLHALAKRIQSGLQGLDGHETHYRDEARTSQG